jgi:hypothetical protein
MERFQRFAGDPPRSTPVPLGLDRSWRWLNAAIVLPEAIKSPDAGRRAMSNRITFRRASAAQPDDDTPRLVFANWLE